VEPLEFVAAIVAIAFGAGIWLLWLRRLYAVRPLLVGRGRSWWMPAALVAFTLINFAVLRTIAAGDVRNAPQYIAFYLVLGLAVSGIVLLGLSLFGIRPADISQRHNRAAAIFAFLALNGSAFAYAGGNVGDGPGFHVVLFCTILSVGALFAIQGLHAALAHTSYRILVERDVCTGLRAGCMLVACGICLGRAVAGTWISLDLTLADFLRNGWPAVVLCAADVGVAWTTRSLEPNRNLPLHAAFGIAEIAAAVAYVGRLGIPS